MKGKKNNRFFLYSSFLVYKLLEYHFIKYNHSKCLLLIWLLYEILFKPAGRSFSYESKRIVPNLPISEDFDNIFLSWVCDHLEQFDLHSRNQSFPLRAMFRYRQSNQFIIHSVIHNTLSTWPFSYYKLLLIF